MSLSNMFQISPPSFTSPYSFRKTSPLAPRNPHACPRFSDYMASKAKSSNIKSVHSQKRPAQNPLQLPKPVEEQDRRRQVYLKRVRQTSDDKKWEARSEQILRADFMSRRKQWEIQQARSAPEPLAAPDDEDMAGTFDATNELDFLDEILSQEDQELEAIVSSMEDDPRQEDYQSYQMSNYGSDDEEYDKLFMEVMSEEEGNANSAARSVMAKPEDDRAMDVS
ncbi:hypothetical protein N7G274_004682 [Stereocaulon virgatum]|uniref:Uncharacterized protein n=1 Tax=Stereocaulon virgatum TaxID=373712 RepID=A0ABR4A8I6_9LECA